MKSKRIKNIKVDEEIWYRLSRLKLKMRKPKLSDVIAELIKPSKVKLKPKKRKLTKPKIRKRSKKR